jgi:hypothetical protein
LTTCGGGDHTTNQAPRDDDEDRRLRHLNKQTPPPGKSILYFPGVHHALDEEWDQVYGYGLWFAVDRQQHRLRSATVAALAARAMTLPVRRQATLPATRNRVKPR